MKRALAMAQRVFAITAVTLLAGCAPTLHQQHRAQLNQVHVGMTTEEFTQVLPDAAPVGAKEGFQKYELTGDEWDEHGNLERQSVPFYFKDGRLDHWGHAD